MSTGGDLLGSCVAATDILPARADDDLQVGIWRSRGLRARLMTPADAPATARLHLRYLPEGFFLQLGAAFVTRWHRAFIQQPHGWAAVVVDAEDQVVSYALVATRHRDFVEGVIRSHGLALAASGALALAGRPRLLLHFLRTRTLRYLRRIAVAALRRTRLLQPSAPAVATSERVVEAVVHAVVTIESARGIGCAATLLGAAEQAARAEGATVMALVTDDIPAQCTATAAFTSGCTSPPRQGAAGLYEHLGWKRTAERLRDGRRILEYQRTLSPLQDSAMTENTSAPTSAAPSVQCTEPASRTGPGSDFPPPRR